MRKLAWAASLILLIATRAAADDVVKVGIIKTTGDMAVLIADAKGYFKQEGINVDLTSFDGSAKMVAPLGVGDLDVGGGSTAAGLFNAIDRGVGLRIVASKGRTAPGYVYQSVIVRKALVESGRFKTYADMKGLKFAQGAQGAGPLALIAEAAAKGGIAYADVEKVFMAFPQQIAALHSGAIDGSIMNEPFRTLAVQEGVGVDFAPTEDIRSNYELSLLLYGDKFRAERPDVAKRFMRAFLRGVRDYNDALADGRWRADGGAEAVIKIFAAGAGAPEALMRRVTPQASDPDGRINMESIRRDLAFFQSEGDVTNKAMTAEQCVDLSIADAAAKELGPYAPRAK